MRNAKEIKTIDGMRYLASAPKNENITGLAEVDGKLYVSTEKHIYTLEDEKRLELIE